MLPTPVVLIAFNRPHLARRTLAAIREAAPERVFLIADGPRADRPDDAALCAETRAVFDEIDWPCQVERKLSDVNLGVEGNVELGLDWVFSQVPEALVFEDDCTPDPTFFPFAQELLDRYRDDRRVWQIAGNRHGVPRRLYGDDSYAFSTWASVWGWATWADRWQRHRAVFPRDHVRRSATDAGDAPVRTKPAVPAPGTLVTRAGQRHFAEAASSDDVVTHGWDKHWWLTIMTEGGLCIAPSGNLVVNSGFGADATHGYAPGREDDPAEPMEFPLKHPPEVALNVEVERELELHLNRVGGPAARLARKVIKSPRLRRAARAAVNSRPAKGAARVASRMAQRS
ncbi:glycosyltransferase family 2 protein [Nocardioides antri]|uniref:Glycosyltransferase family 2 protein n=1 Tax=Nocardioides antri TaxID=2607659 RepID=A0A5B1M3J7_9ACTN|nr:glycosyltransferase family 2 protein [Nocardioides antri]KAA1427473.1 glycosyltransferase family 2 protein [Nocardioides antri]